MALIDSRYAALLFLPYYTSVWLHRLNKASIEEGGQKKYETASYINGMLRTAFFTLRLYTSNWRNDL